MAQRTESDGKYGFGVLKSLPSEYLEERDVKTGGAIIQISGAESQSLLLTLSVRTIQFFKLHVTVLELNSLFMESNNEGEDWIEPVKITEIKSTFLQTLIFLCSYKEIQEAYSCCI